MKDIASRTDIELFMDQFYNKLLPDPIVGYIFTEVAQLDLASHLPVLCDFWETVLLGKSSYRGNVMMKHIDFHKKSALKTEHFERWQAHFVETIDSLFQGPIADEAKRRVEIMKGLMQFKIAKSDEQGFIF